uniref:Uncharacterized protein n=1 Tax=Glossina brevipalpis TaxID=37001 RepID=A0A1A9WHU0_9MUSC
MLRTTEANKRKKLKTRSATLSNSFGYSKDHLDAWLETCLKDASNAQLSSSSEFLDYNPSQNMPNFMKNTNRYTNMFSPMGLTSGGTTSYFSQTEGSQDFASLPPMVNIMGSSSGGGGGGGNGNSSEHENNSTDVLDGSTNNPHISRGFILIPLIDQFSDPCLLNPSDNDSKLSGQNTPDKRAGLTIDADNNTNKFFSILMEQIQLLHETNSKICRNLHETKVDIEALKHAPSWGLRHRRDSISGLSTHSQPMIFGGGFGGTQSPAPTYHSGAYTPGMMTDVVREVKEAARVREDALLNRVKALVEERQWSINESNLRIMRDLEELKSQVHHLRLERKESNKRINHLEAENKYMRQILASIFNNSNRHVPDIIYENETLRPRKPFPHTRRAAQPLNLQYGTIHHQSMPKSLSVDEQDEEPLHIIETPSINSTVNDIISVNAQKPIEMRNNSFSSSDGGSINNDIGNNNSTSTSTTTTTTTTTSITNTKFTPIMSPPNFALISSPPDDMKRTKKLDKTILAKLTKEEIGIGIGIDDIGLENNNTNIMSQDLRRELKEAVAARKDADERIIALEKLVKTLQVHATTTTTSTSTTSTNHTKSATTSSTSIIDVPLQQPQKQKQQQQQQEQQQQQQQQQQHLSNGDGNILLLNSTGATIFTNNY